MEYKLRAECLPDVQQFIFQQIRNIRKYSIISPNGSIPDVDFEFETDLTLQEIILVLHDIEDSHVMYQTVQPIEKYTGERNYDID